MNDENQIVVSGENISIDAFINILKKFMLEANEAVLGIMNSEVVQDGTVILSEIGQTVSEAIKYINAVKKIASIPTSLFLKKFERYCKGLIDIPLEKRQKYIERLGKDKFNKESVFILNIINRIEEIEKLPLFIKLLSAKMDDLINDDEYRRLMILVDRTLYQDLIYLKDNITNDPVRLITDSDYGLVASGLLISAGSQWLDGNDSTDSGVRFNYTLSAKKIVKHLFEVECDDNPSNKDIARMTTVTADDIDRLVNRR